MRLKTLKTPKLVDEGKSSRRSNVHGLGIARVVHAGVFISSRQLARFFCSQLSFPFTHAVHITSEFFIHFVSLMRMNFYVDAVMLGSGTCDPSSC